MGRAALGDEGRTVQAGLKITPNEERALTVAFGSPGKGLRALLDSYRTGWLENPPVAHERVAHPAIEDDDVEVTTALALAEHYEQTPDEIVREADLPMRTAHRHKPKDHVRNDFDLGKKIEVWVCECGQELQR